MRTTIRIDDELYREVQPTGAGGLRSGVDLTSNASLADVMDDGAGLDAPRSH